MFNIVSLYYLVLFLLTVGICTFDVTVGLIVGAVGILFLWLLGYIKRAKK